MRYILQSNLGAQWKEKAAEFISWRGLEDTADFEDWAQENNLEFNQDTQGFSQYSKYNFVVSSMKNLGNANCEN